MGGSILLLTLIIIAIFFFIIDCSANQALTETINSVKGTFTATIEEIEPGKIMNTNLDDDSSHPVLPPPSHAGF